MPSLEILHRLNVFFAGGSDILKLSIYIRDDGHGFADLRPLCESLREYMTKRERFNYRQKDRTFLFIFFDLRSNPFYTIPAKTRRKSFVLAGMRTQQQDMNFCSISPNQKKNERFGENYLRISKKSTTFVGKLNNLHYERNM